MCFVCISSVARCIRPARGVRPSVCGFVAIASTEEAFASLERRACYSRRAAPLCLTRLCLLYISSSAIATPARLRLSQMQSQSRPPAEATWSDLPRENAQVQDIALYKRERAVHQGSLIAVNANWTCYAIRGARAREPPRRRPGCRGPTTTRLPDRWHGARHPSGD